MKFSTVALTAFLAAAACSSTDDTTPGTAPAGNDAGPESNDAAAVADASSTPIQDASPDVNTVEAPLGTCTFGEPGKQHQSPPGDMSTLAVRDGTSIQIQCGSTDGPNTYSLQLAFKDVTGPGTYKGLAQYSEQLTKGGSPTLYNNFTADLVITSLTDAAVAATISFDANGKHIDASLNVPVKK